MKSSPTKRLTNFQKGTNGTTINVIGQHGQRIQCNLQPFQQYVLGKYNQQDDQETSGQIDGKGEDQILNNDLGEEVDVNNNGEWIFNAGRQQFSKELMCSYIIYLKEL